MGLDGCGWVWLGVGVGEWLWVAVGGCGWLWAGVGGCGWVWVGVGTFTYICERECEHAHGVEHLFTHVY